MENIDYKIARIQEIMTEVSTGRALIQNVNKEYKDIYRELNGHYLDTGTKNPNQFIDLWEFYEYWKKKKLATWSSRRAFIIALYKDRGPHKAVLKSSTHSYVSPNRIEELKRVSNDKYSLHRLVKMCQELNSNLELGNYISVGLLLRAILDHTPPIFEKKNFSEVVSSWGTRSFKESMQNLDRSSRKISDALLHTQIRKSEVLPNLTQVDFSNDLDVLLSEIVRVLN